MGRWCLHGCVCSRGGVSTHPHPRIHAILRDMVNKTGGTHPTGMLSCFISDGTCTSKIKWKQGLTCCAGHQNAGFSLALENGENERHFSNQEKVREFKLFLPERQGKVRKFYKMIKVGTLKVSAMFSCNSEYWGVYHMQAIKHGRKEFTKVLTSGIREGLMSEENTMNEVRVLCMIFMVSTNGF